MACFACNVLYDMQTPAVTCTAPIRELHHFLTPIMPGFKDKHLLVANCVSYCQQVSEQQFETFIKLQRELQRLEVAIELYNRIADKFDRSDLQASPGAPSLGIVQAASIITAGICLPGAEYI